MEVAAAQYLANIPAVIAIAGKRISPVSAAQGDAMPRLQYQRVSTVPVRPQGLPPGVRWARLQWTAVGERYGDVKRLAQAVEDAADGFRGTMENAGVTVLGCFAEGQRDLPTPAKAGESRGIDAVSVDWIVWHK